MYIIYTDGAYKPYNAATAIGAWAFVVYTELPTGELQLLAQQSAVMETCAGSHHAELEAISQAVNWVRTQDLRGAVEIRVDNQNAYNHLTHFNTHVALAPLVMSIRDRMGHYQQRTRTRWFFAWVPREENQAADSLAKTARRRYVADGAAEDTA